MSKDYKPGCTCADCTATRKVVRREETKAQDCGCGIAREVVGTVVRTGLVAALAATTGIILPSA